MKYKLTLFCIICLLLSGCIQERKKAETKAPKESETAREIQLPVNQKVVDITFERSNMKIITRKMRKNEEPETINILTPVFDSFIKETIIEKKQ